jgi:hypothetical protein
MGLQCFLLLLGEEMGKTYYFNASKVFLIRTNTVDIPLNTKYPTEKSKDLPAYKDYKDALRHILYHQIDDFLSQMLKSCPLPVFIIGKPVALRKFRQLTKNGRNMKYIRTQNSGNLLCKS